MSLMIFSMEHTALQCDCTLCQRFCPAACRPAAGVVEQYVLLTLLLPTAAVAVVAPRCRCAVLGLPEWTVVMQGKSFHAG